MLGVYLGGWEVYSGVFITQVLCKRCQAVEGRKQRMVPEHFLSSPRIAHSDNIVAMPVGCLPSVARPSYLVGMINMSIKHIPPAQIYAFEVGYQARALKFIRKSSFL